MSIGTYNKGAPVHIEASFVDEDDLAADPTTVALKVMDPSGNIDTYTWAGGTVTRVSQGNFEKDVDTDEEGDWHYWWESTGDAAGAEPGQFLVLPTPF